MFFPEPSHVDEHAEMFFRDDYWKLLAPSLTSLTLGFGDFEFLEKVPHHWLQLLLLLRNLEVLELSAIGEHREWQLLILNFLADLWCKHERCTMRAQVILATFILRRLLSSVGQH